MSSLFGECVDENASDCNKADGEGQRHVERPLDELPTVGLVLPFLHGGHALGELLRAALADAPVRAADDAGTKTFVLLLLLVSLVL